MMTFKAAEFRTEHRPQDSSRQALALKAFASNLLSCVLTCALLMIMIATAGSTQAHAQAPALFFTDLDSGPNARGQSVSGYAGAYVTLFGNFFGSSQGSSNITWNGQSCLRVVSATGNYTGWGSPWLWYQKIVVQIGSSCTPGTGNFVVTVNGAASNGLPFTVRSTGNIRFVCATPMAGQSSCSDSNSGAFATPWRTIKNCKNTIAAGDTCYVQSGVTETSVDAFSAVVTAPVPGGTAGNPKAFVAYPGAVATISCSSGCDYTVAARNIGASNYITLAGFTIRNTYSAGANIGVEVAGGSSYWRVIANDVSCPTAIGNFQGSCMDTGAGSTYIWFVGNYDHDNAQVGSGGATKGFHNMYFSTETFHVWAAWNLIAGDTGVNACNGRQCNACRGIQFHSSPTGSYAGLSQYDLHVHDNVIRNTHCDAINFASVDPGQGPVEAYNNVMYNVGSGVLTGDMSIYSCVTVGSEFYAGPAPSGTVRVYNNSCYNPAAGCPGGGYSQCGAFDMEAPGTTVLNVVNNIIQMTSTAVTAGSTYVSTISETARISGQNNIFYAGAGSIPSGVTGSLTSNPLFLSVPSNLHLQSSSPAIGAGLASWSGGAAPSYDTDGLFRPSPPSIGAHEFSAGISTGPAPPSGLTAVVQ